MVGASYTPSFHPRAYRTEPNAPITAASDLGTLGGTQSFAYGINASGQAVGWAYYPGDLTGAAFRTAPNGLITPSSDLGTLGGNFSEAYAINNSGQVVGDSETTGGATIHAFRTTATGVIDAASDLGTLGGESRAFAINSSGQAVGYYMTTATSDGNRAFFVDSAGPMQPLNSLIVAGSGWVLQEAHGINDSGQISGVGLLRGQRHAFLTVPRGATVTESSSAPASAAISQPDFSAATIDPKKDYSDNAGPPGQTFTPTTDMTLNAITVKGAANTSLTAFAATFTITISKVNVTSLTRLDQEPTDSVLLANGADYLTFTLLNPVSLVAGTQYEFDISTGSGFFGFAKSATNAYAGGAAMQAGTLSGFSPDPRDITNSQTVDRTFFINPVPAPEPTSLSAVIVGVGAILARRTRGSEAGRASKLRRAR